jgi:hypothetical protein
MLKEMYNGSLAKGKRWSAEFRDFWHLPDDFYFSVEENGHARGIAL